MIINSILKISNLDKKKKNYSIFCTFTVENIKTFYSPNWLKQKLLRIGIEPSNNILDLKDYIRLETGYPFEIYDLDKIRLAINDKNFKLSLNCEKLLEPFQGSNNFQFNGNSNVLVLKANQEILSIAGRGLRGYWLVIIKLLVSSTLSLGICITQEQHEYLESKQ